MNRGFTLLELIVCIAIIALLAGLLLPVVANSRKNSHKAVCENNLRSVGQALRVYVDDNDGAWPPSHVWRQWNLTETAKLTGCPLTVVPLEKQAEMEARKWILGYAYNQDLFDWNTTVRIVNGEITTYHDPTTDKDILYPTATIAVSEAEYSRSFTYDVDPHQGASPYPYGAERGWERHNGGANYLFCDGHVKWLRAEQVRNGYPRINDGTQATFALQTKTDE